MKPSGTTRHRLGIAHALLLLVCACDSADSSEDGQSPSEDGGQRPEGDSGRDAGRTDASSSESDGGDTHVWDASGMRVYLDGSEIRLAVRDGVQLFTLSCTGAIALQKKQGDAWVAARDDRPPWNQNPGYYLDGVYVPSMFNLGCDAIGCYELPEDTLVGRAVEVVKTGTRAAPKGSNARTEVIDVFETRPLEGQVRVRVTYSTETRCQDSLEAALELNVPPGVCECGAGMDLDGGT